IEFKNAGMEWLVIEELKELLRFWKTDLEFTKELKAKDLDGCYATRTVNIINKFDRLAELLDALHEQLLECNTSEECFTRFPEVQNILEDLVCIRILTLHDTLCQKIIECLLEYTKLFDKMDNVFTHFIGLPKYWCLKVLRTISIGHSQGDNATEKLAYLCGAGSSDLDNSYIEEAVSIITNFLDNIENCLFQLPSTCIINVSEQLIPLLQVPDMFGLIERIILFATKDKLYHTINTEYETILSERFVEYLVSFHHDIYMKLCNQAKLGLWTNCHAAVEHETLASFQQLLFPVNKDYMTPRSITEFLQNKPFFYQVINYPKIFGLCFDVFIKCLEVSPDWRVLRLIKYTITHVIESKDRNGFIPLDITSYFPKLLERLVTVLANDTPGTHAFYKMNSLRRNLLLEQSPSAIHNYRKCVWIILMSFTKWHYWIIEAFFDIQSNAIGDLITSIRECLKLNQNGKEKVLKCLKRYRHILKSNLVLVDITLGLWSKTKSLEFMEEILNACIMSNDHSSSRQMQTMQTNEDINLSALTKILDYFYENQYEKNEEIMKYLNRLKERCIM
ncbi:3866_t:CDS:10, partial [Funneliformis caledonium]